MTVAQLRKLIFEKSKSLLIVAKHIIIDHIAGHRHRVGLAKGKN